jgi:hypothetical protein
MGGDDSHKLLPWRGGHSSPGRSQPGTAKSTLYLNHPKSEDPAPAFSPRILPWTYSPEK